MVQIVQCASKCNLLSEVSVVARAISHYIIALHLLGQSGSPELPSGSYDTHGDPACANIPSIAKNESMIR